MASSVSTALERALPKPKYTGEHEEAQRSAGPRIISASDADKQLARKQTGPPPYGKRAGWRPRSLQDYGDGGAFPEIPVAQYPLDMGRKDSAGQKSNALAVTLKSDGKVNYDAIVRQGHGDKRIIQTSFKDLIPLRQQADMGEISLDRPSEEEVAETKRKTEEALGNLVSTAVAAQKPKNVQGLSRREATFVRYTPANQMGDSTKKQDRIMKIVQKQVDPMEPPKFKHKKIPRGPPSPPPPIMRSPPRKLTAADQEAWKIPPAISSWKNPKGYTVPLDKRLAANGRGLQDVTINDKHAHLAEALGMADRAAREEVQQRQLMQRRLAEKEKSEKEEELRQMAQKARDDAAAARAHDSRTSPRRDRRSPSYDSRDRSRTRSYSASSYGSRRDSRSQSRSQSFDSEDERREAQQARERRRREQRQENQRELRRNHMGAERKIQVMAREQDRDISEKVALGLAKPTASGQSMYDSRLFNQDSGFNTGFNEDQPYDKPLFAAQEAINNIYRPRAEADDDVDDAESGQREMDRIGKQNRFEVLGKVKQGFRGADIADERSGPVQFERETNNDPFGIDSMIQEASGAAAARDRDREQQQQQQGKQQPEGTKRYGLQEMTDRPSKRARVDDDDDNDAHDDD